MGHRANFEERYSGPSLRGSYFAGIFYPDKTRVGWWKVGYPEYFGKMINSVNWLGIDVAIDGEQLDLAKCEVGGFRRVLDMHEATLTRSFHAKLSSGKRVHVEAVRFISAADTKLAAIRYSVTPIDFAGTITFKPYLDGDVSNRDSNYGEKFWEEVDSDIRGQACYLQVKTKQIAFHVSSGIDLHHVCSGMCTALEKGNEPIAIAPDREQRENYVAEKFAVQAAQGESVTLLKYVCNATTLDFDEKALPGIVQSALASASEAGFDALRRAHCRVWEQKWDKSDIIVEGDDSAQQAIRFNIFQLNQTYTGEDARLNIGPKGFTGEKYGGGTYWDTEAFCFPFYLNTADPCVARNLLIYRYRQLPKAIANARKLGFTGGAAMYPMVTINGEECHNEWEITFEEIHRNGSLAFAICRYVTHTRDEKYLAEYGLETLIAHARFWSRRATYSKNRRKYVILGVTGPNEYENNVNNNWYTNFIARWTLRYALSVLDIVRARYPADYDRVVLATKLDETTEPAKWAGVADNIYLPVIEGTNIMLQQDGFLDKEQSLAADIPADERPINQHWSWDRILRSVFIKQADVLQGIYFFLEDFPMEVVRDNFAFYEPRTVHESSLSPSIHSVIASHIGDIDKAYELYLRTARLDLDDYNNEVGDGLHITSMAGSWLAVVEGFARKRIVDDLLAFSPLIPPQWNKYAFKIEFRGHIIEVTVSKTQVRIANRSCSPLDVRVYGRLHTIAANETLRCETTCLALAPA
jgi:maltose phosphorylase